MDIKSLIIRLLNKKGRLKVSEIAKQTGFSRAYINRFFQELRNEGKIILLGKANRAMYVPIGQKAALKAKKNINNLHKLLINKGLSEDDVLAQIKNTTGIFIGLPENISKIIDYAFTEMFNNAIEHSKSRNIEFNIERHKNAVFFNITDKGIGIFDNIMKKRRLHNRIEAIQDLLKGKQSTAPETHSGEGIFFTSKVADMLIIQSSTKKLIFDNLLNDIFIRDIKNIKGTKVIFSAAIDSKKQLRDIFNQYADDSFSFSKTEVTVKLYKMGSDYISRSQARRIFSGLDKFKTVILDFKNVETAGQAFADEIFRVWKKCNPKTKIERINTNENIEFMIKRASQP